MDEIRFIDLFSGIGGFRRGLELSGGYRCVWSCDKDKYANQVYTSRFGEENHHSGDIRKVKATSIPDHDILCAGFPCQAFSVAGKRGGFEDTRGTLFFEIARIARAKRPTLLLLENVRGLLSHDEGQTIATILEILVGIGYRCEGQVLNSKWFGVPQNRERVFIVGHLRGRDTRPIFPITEINENAYQGNQWQKGQVSKSLRAESNYNMRGTYIIDPFNKAERKDMMAGALKTNQGSPTSTGTALAILTSNRGGNIKDRVRSVDTTPAWCLGGSETQILGYANAVTDGWLMDTSHHDKPMCEYRIRRLTPVECERLQGFPDGWTEGISDTQRYKCLGNAVTVNVIKFLGDRLKEAFN